MDNGTIKRTVLIERDHVGAVLVNFVWFPSVSERFRVLVILYSDFFRFSDFHFLCKITSPVGACLCSYKDYYLNNIKINKHHYIIQFSIQCWNPLYQSFGSVYQEFPDFEHVLQSFCDDHTFSHAMSSINCSFSVPRSSSGVLQEPKIGLLMAVSFEVQTVSPLVLSRAIRLAGVPGPWKTISRSP